MASRRPRKTDRGVKDFEAVLDAIVSVKIKKKSLRSVANAFNLPRTTLLRHLNAFDAEIPDITKVSSEQLLEIVRRIASPYANTAEARFF